MATLSWGLPPLVSCKRRLSVHSQIAVQAAAQELRTKRAARELACLTMCLGQLLQVPQSHPCKSRTDMGLKEQGEVGVNWWKCMS